MTFESHPIPLCRRMIAWPVRMLALAVVVLPMSAVADTTLNDRDVFRFLNTAVSHYYQKNVRRWQMESACYFDPQVEKSMACAWRTGGGGADPYRLKQRVQRDGTKWCRNNGGNSCTLFWRNGKLRFDWV